MALELVDDLRYSILELNAHAMQRSQTGQLLDAQQLLETAYIRLQSADAAVLAADAGLVDQLKATTLSNLGVVECHKKELDKSLDHLEAALTIEKRIGIFSPTTALNLCATFNALGRFEEAVDICTGAVNALMSTNGGRPTDENKTLWAAAWHNLSVAEMNLGGEIGGPEDRRVAVLNMFKNAMRASIDLLGPRHPLTATIHDSYRAARPTLKKQGAYKLRDPLLPMLSTSANATTLEKRRQIHTQYLTEDEKLGAAPAYEGALAGNTGRTCINRDASRRVPSLLAAVRDAQRGERGFRPTQTLVRAQPLYLSHHPATSAAPRQSELLLQPRQREMRQQKIPSIAAGWNNQSSSRNSPNQRRILASSQRQQQLQQIQQQQNSDHNNTNRTSPKQRNASSARSAPAVAVAVAGAGGGGQFGSTTSKVLSSLTNRGDYDQQQFSPQHSGFGGAGAVSWNATNLNNASNNKRSLEQALIQDMWVEVEIPLARRSSPPQSATNRGGGIGGGGGTGRGFAPALRQAGGSPGGTSSYNPALGIWTNSNEFRAPSYGQAMHVIEPSDPIMERVAQPSSYASLDKNSGGGASSSYNSNLNFLHQQQQNMSTSNSVGAAVVAPHPLPQQQQVKLVPINNQQQQPQSEPRSLAQQPNVFAPVTVVLQHQQQQQAKESPSSPPIPQPPRRPPSGNASSRPSAVAVQQQQQQQQRQQQQQQGFNYLADALGSDINEYPGLAMLSSM